MRLHVPSPIRNRSLLCGYHALSPALPLAGLRERKARTAGTTGKRWTLVPLFKSWAAAYPNAMSAPKRLFPDGLRESSHRLNDCLEPYGMSVQTYKTIKALLVSLAIIAFSAWLVNQGIPPREVIWPTFILLMLINGVELPELLAAWTEVSGDTNDDE